MAVPGETYLVYVRGTTDALELDLGARQRRFSIREFNPRSGESRTIGNQMINRKYKYNAPDREDWVVFLEGR